MNKIAKELVELTKDILQEEAKIASKYGNAWWNKFFKELKEWLYDLDAFDFTAEVKGEIDWEYEPANYERAYGDYGPMLMESPGGGYIDGLNVDYEFTRNSYVKDYKLSEIIKDLRVPDMPEPSVFMNPRDPLGKEFQKRLKRGINGEMSVFTNSDDFESVDDNKLDGINIVLYFKVENKKLVLDNYKFNEKKFKKMLKETIEENEPVPESEPDYP